MVEAKQPKFLTALILTYVFFGLSQLTTSFWFPAFGDVIFELIKFYSTAVVFLLILTKVQNIEIQSISLLGAGANFFIFLIPFYFLFTLLFTGTLSWSVPTHLIAAQELIISLSENYIAFILLPAVIPWGSAGGTIAEKTFMTIRGYPIGYKIPDLQRFKQGIPAILFISLLHVGSYSKGATDFNQFYLSMFIVIIMFAFFWLIRLSFGFGSAEAGHFSWNSALLSGKLTVWAEKIAGLTIGRIPI